MYASGTSHGFVIRDRDEDQDAAQKFNSRENGSNRPTLVLTLREGAPTTPPPPTNPPVPPVPPVPPAPTCTSQSVKAAADAWFEQGSTSNKGDDSSLVVQSKSGQAFRALVRFALPATPAGCTLDRAELRLYAESIKPDRTIQVQAVTSAWQEMGVTWDTQPATSGPVATTSSGTDKGWRSWDVTQLVGGAGLGVVIRDADESGDAEQKFNSREKGTDVPTLVLTYRAQ